jgi:hypothetical protein
VSLAGLKGDALILDARTQVLKGGSGLPADRADRRGVRGDAHLQ